MTWPLPFARALLDFDGSYCATCYDHYGNPFSLGADLSRYRHGRNRRRRDVLCFCRRFRCFYAVGGNHGGSTARAFSALGRYGLHVVWHMVFNSDRLALNLWTFCRLIGGWSGHIMAVRSTIWVLYGRPHLGKIQGTLTTVEVAASSLGPLIMGATHDLWGSYNDILTVFALLTAPMILITLFATQPTARS